MLGDVSPVIVISVPFINMFYFADIVHFWIYFVDVSSSSGTGSPLNFPIGSIGFIRKGGFESNDDFSDGSRRSSYSRKPGYETPATAVVTDSEDEIVFTNGKNWVLTC